MGGDYAIVKPKRCLLSPVSVVTKHSTTTIAHPRIAAAFVVNNSVGSVDSVHHALSAICYQYTISDTVQHDGPDQHGQAL